MWFIWAVVIRGFWEQGRRPGQGKKPGPKRIARRDALSISVEDIQDGLLGPAILVLRHKTGETDRSRVVRCLVKRVVVSCSVVVYPRPETDYRSRNRWPPGFIKNRISSCRRSSIFPGIVIRSHDLQSRQRSQHVASYQDEVPVGIHLRDKNAGEDFSNVTRISRAFPDQEPRHRCKSNSYVKRDVATGVVVQNGDGLFVIGIQPLRERLQSVVAALVERLAWE